MEREHKESFHEELADELKDSSTRMKRRWRREMFASSNTSRFCFPYPISHTSVTVSETLISSGSMSRS